MITTLQNCFYALMDLPGQLGLNDIAMLLIGAAVFFGLVLGVGLSFWLSCLPNKQLEQFKGEKP